MSLLLDMLASTEAVSGTETPVAKSSSIWLMEDKVDWWLGRSICNSFGGELLSFGSKEEVTMVRKTIWLRYGVEKGQFWIGINDIDNDGIYSWSDGSKLTYVNWGSKFTGSNCGYAVWTELISGWFATSCDYKMMCICRVWL